LITNISEELAAPTSA